MQKINYILLILTICCFQFSWSQTVEIEGKIESNEDVENIHVINKTAQRFTITNKDGEFVISAKVNDTLVVSSIQYKLKTFVVDLEMVLSKKITVKLEDLVNELDEVVVGSMLTGDLNRDMSNVEGKPITAASLGIPSYQGPVKTQSERRLQEASDFNPTAGGSLGGVGGSISIIPIINAISGRTKQLKKRVELETKDALMFQVKARLSEDLFLDSPLHEDYVMDYFYFVSEDENFLVKCRNKSDLEILVFLKEKLNQYKTNQKIKED